VLHLAVRFVPETVKPSTEITVVESLFHESAVAEAKNRHAKRLLSALT
jgi:hypothetical protein